MQTNIYFVRHAHSTYTPDELRRPLSERGLRDAQSVTDVLKSESIDYVISSPYKRAIQTVEGIAKLIDKEIIIEEDFKERKLAEGSVADFREAIKKVWADPDFSWKGGESNNYAQKRGVEITLEVLKNYEGRNIVIGTHGNIMVLIMNYFDTIFDFTFWQKLDMPDIYKLTFSGRELIGVNRIWGADNNG
ncbi:histidine phosphatase family protein [Lederbergia wuyishanensis]|uniref:2,3-bisphosphoglycerate-dependent phosphoglycerate mutase n=1 Tax=Lederbergia wuyishanensis TaxID=1347903 RepID=A0ABU0D8E5_9BACI|nr:histidine phosphatase family protein [Lederbergia wuyishanensis]MCJ8009169.1 histidine phosphatase family protein [Lederbergia wuyishanensis]MDQ0344702.1 2,3-bisphosphoglycerate-dependent phosphoglycerate mutase [Lederbergia wuyishanensis]